MWLRIICFLKDGRGKCLYLETFTFWWYYYFLTAVPADSRTVIITAEEGPESEEVFTDNWNYKNLDHSKIPILSSLLKNHTLPPKAEGTVSRYLYVFAYIIIIIN